jgi:hypothetical protein
VKGADVPNAPSETVQVVDAAYRAFLVPHTQVRDDAVAEAHRVHRQAVGEAARVFAEATGEVEQAKTAFNAAVAAAQGVHKAALAEADRAFDTVKQFADAALRLADTKARGAAKRAVRAVLDQTANPTPTEGSPGTQTQTDARPLHERTREAAQAARAVETEPARQAHARALEDAEGIRLEARRRADEELSAAVEAALAIWRQATEKLICPGSG